MNHCVKRLLPLCFCLSAGAASAAGLVIEEIVVTAQKRAESVQDVPVAVNAVDADTIEAMGIDEFTDLTSVSPSLTMTGGDWATNSGISLRGIGTNVFSINIEPSVSVVLDDVPLVRSAQAFSDLIDIERIEVLRGPQSTLFGKSSSAGVVNIVTQGPGDAFNGRVSVQGTDDDELSFGATIGGPLSDTLGFRLTGFSKDREDGHIRNTFDGGDLNGSKSHGARGKLVWDISDRVTATLSAEFSSAESDCCSTTFREIPAGALFLGALPSALVLGGLDVGEAVDDTSVDNPARTETDDWGVGLKFAVALGEHELLSITSMKEWEYDVFTDVDGTAFDFLSIFTGGALTGGINQGGGFELEALSQEFRLLSPTSETFEYVAGLYYADVTYDRNFNRGPLFGANWTADTGTESLAVFGQGTWHLSDATNLIFGLRYNREEISHRFNNLISGLSFSGSDTETAVPGKLGVQHFFSDDVMAFATYSRGYKGQGYDISSSFNQRTSDNPVGSEDSDAFEVGLKATLLDGRLQINPTLFFARYDDFQAQQTRIVNNVVELGIANVGELETWGLEVDFVALISENLRLVGGLAWIDATIEEFPGADCYTSQTAAQGCLEIVDSTGAGTGSFVQDLGGADLNNSPDLKLTLSAEYTLPLESLPFDGFVNASVAYQDDVHFSLLADPGTEQDAYAIVNLSFGIVSKGDLRYKVTAFVNNLFDEEYVQGIGNFGGLWGNAPVYIQQVPREAQRYAGVRLSFDF